MNPIIQVKNFTKKYGDFVAVNDISFDVEEGSVFAFLGPNGAGKAQRLIRYVPFLKKLPVRY